MAAWRNRGACVRLLLDRGADVGIRDYGDNAYALHFAADAADLDVVALLVEAGSDVVGEGDDPQSLVRHRARPGGRRAIVTVLLAAGAKLDFLSVLYLECYDEAEAMLRDDPSRIGPDGRDTIALHLSVSRKNTAAVRWLIAHGVDVNAKGNLWDCSHTALHMTAERGAVEMARLLLDAGADPTSAMTSTTRRCSAGRSIASSRKSPSLCAGAAELRKLWNGRRPMRQNRCSPKTRDRARRWHGQTQQRK